MKTINAFDPAAIDGLPARRQALIRRREALLGPAYRLFYQDPVELVRGEGVWVWDTEGKRYLDAYNNVVSLGHCHPHVLHALQTQAAKLNTHTRYLNEALLDYAERLLATHHASLNRIMFTCTGSEANDLALRLAQFHTGGTGVIVTEWAYHGVTQTTSACSPSLGNLASGLPQVYTVPAPRAYGNTDADVGAAFAAGVDAALARMQADGVRPAALLFDSLFTSDGVYGAPAGFLALAVARARAAGMVVIADEVQPGFGRTGTHLWGYQRHGIAPHFQWCHPAPRTEARHQSRAILVVQIQMRPGHERQRASRQMHGADVVGFDRKAAVAGQLAQRAQIRARFEQRLGR